MTLPVCPRCHRTILPIPVPVNSLDLQKVIYTYGQDKHCIGCEWDSPEFSEELCFEVVA